VTLSLAAILLAAKMDGTGAPALRRVADRCRHLRSSHDL